MTPTWTAALRLTRPAQWPILTGQLLVGMLLAAPALGPAGNEWLGGLPWWRLAAAWLAWVVLLNGGTLAFNSAYDRDTEAVAYLANPPEPPPWLAAAALLAMMLGAGLGTILVGWFFGGLVWGCLALSVLYSHPRTRWKSRPGLDLLTNMVGYGAGTTLAGLTAAGGGSPSAAGWWLATGFGLLFGSFYPLTQVYQTRADRQRGDRTLTTALGIRTALVVALVLGLAAGFTLSWGCYGAGRVSWWSLLVGVLLVWNIHVGWWLIRAARWTEADHEGGMYRALVLWTVVDIGLALVWLRG